MGKSLIGILTYRRLHALKTMMAGIEEHCPQYPVVISEDCGNRDGTTKFLTDRRTAEPVPLLQSTKYVAPDSGNCVYPNADVYIGDRNVGVAGNSNRILKVFADGDWDHLVLCNDDLLVTGDFVKFYAQAHRDLNVGMFCWCGFDKASPAISGRPETYKWTTYPWRGYGVKFLPRFTGIMISITRELFDKIGYFDSEFGKFGEDHCDFTVRARLAGGIRLDKQDMHCLDVEHKLLSYQEVETSVTGAVRHRADREASRIMQRAAYEYTHRHYYRPFGINFPESAGGYSGEGIACRVLSRIGYKLINAPS